MYNALPKDNQFFVGAIWIAVIGGLTTFLYYLVQNIYEFCTRYVIIKVSLDNKTEVFEWILRWLSVNKSVFSAQNLAIRVSRTTKTKWWKENSDEKPNVEILPGPGDHLFYYQGHLVWLNRTQSDKVTTTGWQRKPFIFESLTLSTLGRDQKIFSDLFMEAQKFCTVQDSSETKIYILSDDGDEWLNVLKKKPRALETVILDTTLANELITDAKDFFTKQEWYVDRGIPYRRGYLLYGPPGNGKTSFIQSLAGELKLDICVLGLSSNSLDDQSLNQRLHEVPANAIILLEDVDAVFVNRNTAEGMSDSGKKRVTFSGLLNAIDGVASQEGKLLFMTTNHIEKLDPALIRPGRCDVKREFKLASKDQINKMFLRFFPDELDLALEFTKLIPANTVSMATLQKHFMESKEDPKQSVKDAFKLLEIKKDDSNFVLISTWLKRLGLAKYTKGFTKEKCYVLEDLIGNDSESSLMETFGVKTIGDAVLIQSMLAGRKDIRHDFELCSYEQSESLFESYCGKEEADEFAKQVKDKFSTFELKNYLQEHKSIKDLHLLLHPEEEKSGWISLDQWIENEKFDEIMHAIPVESVDEKKDSKKDGDVTPVHEEKKELKSVYQKLIQEEILTTFELSYITESDMKTYGITKKGDLLRVGKALKALETERTNLD